MDDPPATRQPAPGGLALVQDFVNSTELPGGWDELADVALTASWLRAHGFELTPDEAQRRRIVETRENLRTVLGVNSGQPLPEAAAARLGKLLDAASVHPAVGAEGVRLASPSLGADGFLAAILTALLESSITGTFRRLKVCRSDSCQWTFYDSSKNGCGAWCSMRVCGARAKAKAYRERHRAGAESAVPGATAPA
ncbi:MAG: CGNR zinc finger domain-containing protein [Candidatus Dormibacteraeota bacterium]|uniref:CGNR zinc finger domain-containing protein n=1 Tax=Candidatus Amunia macphersoniae TaxID=3127014 RepID=A0A934KP11_9BACT|nr:CGNR zinc finger domain-containing protein [Candidatus Dormibacteraeota bacterium]